MCQHSVDTWRPTFESSYAPRAAIAEVREREAKIEKPPAMQQQAAVVYLAAVDVGGNGVVQTHLQQHGVGVSFAVMVDRWIDQPASHVPWRGCTGAGR